MEEEEEKMMLIEEVVKMEEIKRREGGYKVKVWDMESLRGQREDVEGGEAI